MVAEALLQAAGDELEDDAIEEPVTKRGKGGKGETRETKPKRKERDGEGLIGEGTGRTMREKARRKQM